DERNQQKLERPLCKGRHQSLHDACPSVSHEISWSDLHATCCEFAVRQKPARGLQAGRLLRVLRREGSRGTWEFCGRLQHRQWEHWWKHARARCNRDSDLLPRIKEQPQSCFFAGRSQQGLECPRVHADPCDRETRCAYLRSAWSYGGVLQRRGAFSD